MENSILLLVILFLSRKVELGSTNLEALLSGQEAKRKGSLSSSRIVIPLQWDVKTGLLWPQVQRCQPKRQGNLNESPHTEMYQESGSPQLYHRCENKV